MDHPESVVDGDLVKGKLKEITSELRQLLDTQGVQQRLVWLRRPVWSIGL